MAETSIDKLTLDIVVNNDNASRRINAITKAIDKLNTAMGKSGNIEKVLDKINNVSPSSTRGGRTSKGGSNKKNDLNIFGTLGKWSYLINMMRYYGRSLSSIVQLSMDYVETQNLWQVANRNNLQMAEEFIQKMNKAYGVSEATLMNYQAIFKNMLSALGDLSDEVSSGLSMQLTQMALDFSSLYNVTIPSAMQKFQAVLSGQVRPIRSISGYDITENTIFDLYAGAGGEKTMRQLSQIEKRLLRIVAVFDQMSATGATGDMAKTIESASNQARIMNEQFKETLTWTGNIILMWLDSVGVFQYINAVLITIKEVIKAIAYDMGYQDKDFLDGMVMGAESATEAVDELQGKLLSFDKFEALNSDKGNILGIDQTVLSLLEKVKLETEEFSMEAQNIAQGWLDSLGFVDKNADGILDITEKARELLKTVKEISTVVGGLIGLKIVTGVGKFVVSLFTLNNALGVLSTVLATGAIYAIMKAVEAFKEGDTWGGVFASVVGTVLVGSFIALRIQMLQTTGVGKLLVTLIARATLACGSFAGGIALVTGGFLALASAGVGAFLLIKNWGDMSAWQKIIGVLGVATTAILGLAMALGAFHSAWSIGLAVTGIVAGIAMMTASIASVKKEINIPAYATGGFPEDGLFFANSGEMVGQFSNGRTAVANNDQIVTGITQGVYNAMMAYNAQTRGQGGAGDVYLDGTKVGRVVAKGSHSEMVRVGLIKANS